MVHLVGEHLQLLEDATLDFGVEGSSEDRQHRLEPVQTDELMLVVHFVHASHAAQSAVVALPVEAQHHHLLALMRRTLLAEVLVRVEPHHYQRFYIEANWG